MDSINCLVDRESSSQYITIYCFIEYKVKQCIFYKRDTPLKEQGVLLSINVVGLTQLGFVNHGINKACNLVHALFGITAVVLSGE